MRLFLGLLKNVQMQGSRNAFHLPVRQAILRVASRRIRSDFCHADESVRRPEVYFEGTSILRFRSPALTRILGRSYPAGNTEVDFLDLRIGLELGGRTF